MADWMLQLAGYVGAAAAVYAGIRADLAALRVKVEGATAAASSAHRRIDGLMVNSRGMHG